MVQDLVLLTVDSWRHDTTDLVPNLSRQLSGQTEAICAGAATNWVFPAILNSRYYPDAYEPDGTLRSDITSLPEMLSEVGFATGGFVACNPYVSKWKDQFDVFWNGGLATESGEWYSSTIEKWLSRGYRTALLKKRVSASEIAQRASAWYTQQDGPRFLWLHLMEPHLPYYPGIQRAREIGLVKTYRSILSYQQHHDDTPAEAMNVQRALYNQCVELFDAHVPDLLNFVDSDAAIVALGDHGEEFDHGHYDHERLYDECVRVPVFFENMPQLQTTGSVRQIDLAPAMLRRAGIDVPEDWTGTGIALLNDKPALMLTPQDDAKLLHAGGRTGTTKLIKSFNQKTGELVNTEAYDVSSDPNETENIYPNGVDGKLEERLDEFITEYKPALEMNATTGIESEVVASRLEDLGYK